MMGNLSRIGWILLLGLCDGDAALAEEVRAALYEDKSMREAARDAGMARSTFCDTVKSVKERLARVLDAGVTAAELVDAA